MLGKKFFAFTLAEVLITLGIIGVVAAMTIPTLITGYQKKVTVAKLQKAIAVFNQAYRLSYNDNGDIDDSLSTEQIFNTYWAPYIKRAVLCTSAYVCRYKSNDPFYTTSKNRAGFTLIHPSSRYVFMTPDGFTYIIFKTSFNIDRSEVKSKLITVDINGAEGPNRYGRDVFALKYESGGNGIVPMGNDKTDRQINKSCSKTSTVITATDSYCAERIRRNGWVIDKDYPW